MAIENATWAKWKSIPELVRKECANFQHERCLRTNLPCSLMFDEPSACAYFEVSILPAVPTVKGEKRLLELYALGLARRDDGMPALLTTKAKAQWSEYLDRDKRTCPDCGGPISPRRRRCADCQKALQRQKRRRK